MSDPDVENLPLILKYRPIRLSEVFGHDDIVHALERALASSTCPHAYLLTGQSGIGKTTIARCIANALDAEVLEIDAASNNSIDSVRELQYLGQHMPLSGQARRMIIIDEAHGLSKNAKEAILKLLEEPPAHLYIALCTTELSQITETMRTRCYHVSLPPLAAKKIEEYILMICDFEDWRPNGDVLALVVSAAEGSPRKALTLMQAAHDAKSLEEAKRIVSLHEDTDEVTELLQLLLGQRQVNWSSVQKAINSIDETQYQENATLGQRYVMGALLRERDETKAQRMWMLLDSMVFPSGTFDRKAAFVAAIGRYMWGK